METSQILILVGCVIVVIVLYKILKSVLKLIIPLIIIGIGSYYLYSTISETNLIQEFEKINCQQPDDVRCKCISNIVMEEIKRSKTGSELEALSKDVVASIDLLKSTVLGNKTQIIQCLEENGYDVDSFDELVKELELFN